MNETTIHPRILVVDDVPEVRALVEAILTRQGYVTRTVGSGKEALALMRSGLTFDLVLLDINMPGLDGFATFRELQQFRSVRPFAIAFLTGRKDKDEVQEAMPFHPDAYLVKPVEASLLKRKVRELLQLAFRGRFLPRTRVDFPAEITGVPLKYTFLLKEISELELRVEGMLEFVKGALVTFRSDELALRIGVDAEFSFRVRRVESESSGFYISEGTFEGMSEATALKMRDALYELPQAERPA